MSKPTLQDKLNYDNKTVAELMKELETLKELAHTRLHELTCKAESLKSLHAQHDTLKSDYALLEEKYYTQSDNYTEVNKEYKDLLDKFTEISAENYALKAEIERTNRHINLAENQLSKEQQPLVVNHYHNCTINK